MHRLTQLILSELQYWDSSSESTSNIQGETELSGNQSKNLVGSTAFYHMKVLAEAIIPFLRFFPQHWQVGTISECPSTWVTLLPYFDDFLRSHAIQLVGPDKLFPVAFP